MAKSEKILSTIVSSDGKPIKWRPKKFREIMTRWGSNAAACENILEGLHIRNTKGESFWELLFQEIRHEHPDWREKSCDAIITMLNMESIIFGLYVEFESGEYFNTHYNWHAQSGELCDRPGFRTLERPFEFLDNAFPIWNSLRPDPNNPDELSPGWKEHFPQSMKYLDEWKEKINNMEPENDQHMQSLLSELNADDVSADDKELIQADIDELKSEYQKEKGRLTDLHKLKKEQLLYGVDMCIKELAKLTEDMFDPQNIVLLLLHPIHGGGILRAMLARAKEGGLDLDGVYEEDEANRHLIKNPDTNWGEAQQRIDYEKLAYEMLKGKEEQVIHSLRMHGLYQCQCRDELKALSRESKSQPARENDSPRRLYKFWELYPNIFDNLHSWFARSLSNTRIIEGAHGFQRVSWDSQRTFQRNNAQLAYLMREEYRNRLKRRMDVYAARGIKENKYKASKKKAAKHCETKPQAVTASNQLNDMVKGRWTPIAIAKRFSKQTLEKYTIRIMNKRGMKVKNKRYEATREAAAQEKQDKRMSKGRYIPKSHEEYEALAKDAQPTHDMHWADGSKREKTRHAIIMLTKKFWNGVPTENFMTELKEVLPNFYNKYVSKLPRKDQNKTYLVRPTKKNGKGGETHENSLGEYVKAVKEIVKKKRVNNLMSPADAKELDGKSASDVYLAFVKVDESEHLANNLQNKEDEENVMLEFIAANGSTITGHDIYKRRKKEFKTYLIDYNAPGEDDQEFGDGTFDEQIAFWEMMEEEEDDEDADEEASSDEIEEDEEVVEEGEEDTNDNE